MEKSRLEKLAKAGNLLGEVYDILDGIDIAWDSARLFNSLNVVHTIVNQEIKDIADDLPGLGVGK